MEFQQLEAEELIIRPLSEEDAPTIFRLSREKSLGDWIPDQVYEDENEAIQVINFLRSQYGPSPDPRERPFVLAVTLRKTEELIGHAGLSPLTNGEVEIGYAIGESHQKRGYASQAVAAVSRWATSNLGLPRINGIVASENVGSGRVLEKAGYILEAEKDHHYLGKIRSCPNVLLLQAQECLRSPNSALRLIATQAPQSPWFTLPRAEARPWLDEYQTAILKRCA